MLVAKVRSPIRQTAFNGCVELVVRLACFSHERPVPGDSRTKHADAKPLKGFSRAGVLEKTGSKTPVTDMELIARRRKVASVRGQPPSLQASSWTHGHA